MRKLLLFALLSVPFIIFGQAERTVLIEEWTNASCGPCAGQNPAFNTLLEANTESVVAIKYQWYFPGFDPMHNQNPDEANDRGSYYGVSGVPTAWIDGFKGDDNYGGGIGDWDIAGGGYEGGPYGHNQAVLDHAATQTTPIEMALTASISEDYANVTVEAVITNISDTEFSMNDGRFQVALIEREILFDSPAGSNGETEFTNVMRKMYPDIEGTAVGTLAAGESVTLTVDGVVPGYIYEISQLSVIAFVQDHSSSEVWQAAQAEFDFTSAFDLSGIAGDVSGLPASICAGEHTVTPTFKLINGGNETLTSADIIYSVNDGTEQTYAWTGSIETLQSEVVDLDPITFEAVDGANFLDVRVDNPNGGTDENTADNAVQAAINLAPTTVNVLELTLVTDNYGSETYWQVSNSAGDVVASGGNAAVGLTNIDVGGGTAPADPGSYGNGQTIVEEIAIDANDCYTFIITDYYGDGICCSYGNGSYVLRDQDGTIMVADGEFQGREDSPFIGEMVVGVEELTAVTELRLFPNPVKETLNVRFNLEEASQLQVEIFNAIGQRVQSLGVANYSTGENQLNLNAATLPNGVYFLRMYNADRELNRRFVVQH